MAPADTAPLPTQVLADSRESASSFLLRVMAANRITPWQLYSAAGRPRPRNLHDEDIRALSHATQTPAQWFEWRVSQTTRIDGELHVRLFGQVWRPGRMLRRIRQQVCPACLREHGLARWEWDLTAFCACPEHGVLLQDHCDHCHQSLGANRPSLDVCRCRHYLSHRHTTLALADPQLVNWCDWISRRLQLERSAPALPSGMASLFAGLSIDAATRVVAAFAGGARHIETGKLNSTQPWLTTSVVASVMSQGLQELASFAQAGSARCELSSQGIADLEDLVVSGLSAADRATAAWLLGRVRGRRRLRVRAVMAMAQQGDLFEEAPR